MAEVLYWISTFVLILTLLCILGSQLMLLVDLEFDYINPYDSTSRINQLVLPEFIIHGIFCFTNLIAGHWFIFLISLPFLYYNVRLYIKREHLADVTEIYNKLNWEKKKRLLKVAYFLMLGMYPHRGCTLIGVLLSMHALIKFLEISKKLQADTFSTLWANPSYEPTSMDKSHGESHPR